MLHEVDAREEGRACFDAREGRACFGVEIKANVPGQTACEEGFVRGQPHIQHKFCQHCRQGFAVPASNIRALGPESAAVFTNSPHEGFWSHRADGLRYRVLNQHSRCKGPALVLFDGPAPQRDDWEVFPAAWLQEGAVVWLCVAYGTITPMLPKRACRRSVPRQAAPVNAAVKPAASSPALPVLAHIAAESSDVTQSGVADV